MYRPTTAIDAADTTITTHAWVVGWTWWILMLMY